MSMNLLSASDMSVGEGALYSLIGFIIVLLVLALLVGIFYLSGFVFKSKLFNKQEETPVISNTSEQADDDDDELVAVITAAVSCMLEEECGGEAPEFIIKRITRKK